MPSSRLLGRALLLEFLFGLFNGRFELPAELVVEDVLFGYVSEQLGLAGIEKPEQLLFEIPEVGHLEEPRVQIEHVAGIRLAARRTPEKKRNFPVRRGVLRKIVVDAKHVAAGVAIVLADRASRVRSEERDGIVFKISRRSRAAGLVRIRRAPRNLRYPAHTGRGHQARQNLALRPM